MPTGVRVFDTRTAAPISQVSDRVICAFDSHVYLGCAVHGLRGETMCELTNLAKARRRWDTISWVLIQDGATPRISAMFYKVVVQSVLLYGSEYWVLSPKMLSKLEGFNKQIARRLTGRMH
jgi:hypothetical protein